MASWTKKRVPELATVWSIKDTFKTAFGSSAKLAAEAMPCMVFIAYACLVVVQNLLATLQEAGRMFVRILCCSVGALGSTLPTRVFLNPEAMARNQTKPTESWQNLRQQLAIRCGLSDEFLAAAVASLTPPTRRDDVLDMLSLIDNPVDDGYDSAVDEFIGPELDFDNPLRVPLVTTATTAAAAAATIIPTLSLRLNADESDNDRSSDNDEPDDDDGGDDNEATDDDDDDYYGKGNVDAEDARFRLAFGDCLFQS